MIDLRSVPPASSSAVELADWLELYALRSADRNSSIQDLARALNRDGSVDELVEEDAERPPKYDELALQCAESAFVEIEDRSRGCAGAYPFEVHDNYIQLLPGGEAAPYIFLLLLSTTAHERDSQPKERVKLFEEMCAEAGRRYFGLAGARATVFGFPRRGIKAFPGALDQLCKDLGEGGSHKRRPTLKDKKDAALDVVIWRDFADQRAGKLIAFGQCATGRHWRDKLTQLQPGAFWDTWIKDAAAHAPLRLFFTPFRLDRTMWYEESRKAGLFFDRCRIASNLDNDTESFAGIGAWVHEVLLSLAA